MNAQERVHNAKTLKDLAEVLNAIHEEAKSGRYDIGNTEIRIDDLVDFTTLPTFGGLEPDSTYEIFSWDETRLLLNDGNEWVVKSRNPEDD